MSYTDAEKRVLLAGLYGGRERDVMWERFPDAIASLARRGLVRIGQEVLGDGTLSSFPLCLSPAGVLEAKGLDEFGQMVGADRPYEQTYWKLAARGSVTI